MSPLTALCVSPSPPPVTLSEFSESQTQSPALFVDEEEEEEEEENKPSKLNLDITEASFASVAANFEVDLGEEKGGGTISDRSSDDSFCSIPDPEEEKKSDPEGSISTILSTIPAEDQERNPSLSSQSSKGNNAHQIPQQPPLFAPPEASFEAVEIDHGVGIAASRGRFAKREETPFSSWTEVVEDDILDVRAVSGSRVSSGPLQSIHPNRSRSSSMRSSSKIRRKPATDQGPRRAIPSQPAPPAKPIISVRLPSRYRGKGYFDGDVYVPMKPPFR